MPLGRGGRMIVVVGMAFEARIAAGLGVRVICGGDGRNLAPRLTRAMAAGCGGVIGSSILDDDEERPTDGRWAQRLMRIIPDTVHGPIAGVGAPVAHSAAKA